MALDPAPGRQTARPTAHLCGRLFIESSRRGSRAPPDAFLPAESPARPTQRAHSARLIPPQTLAKTGDGRAAAPCATAKPQNHDGYRRPPAEGRGPRAEGRLYHRVAHVTDQETEAPRGGTENGPSSWLQSWNLHPGEVALWPRPDHRDFQTWA